MGSIWHTQKQKKYHKEKMKWVSCQRLLDTNDFKAALERPSPFMYNDSLEIVPSVRAACFPGTGVPCPCIKPYIK